MHGVGGRGQLQTAGTDTKPSPAWRGLGGVRRLLRVGDENAVARMVEAALAQRGPSGSQKGGHHVPMSGRPQTQALLGWMEVAGLTCY